MLLRFEVSNHRSIMEPVELSMIAADGDRPAARSFDKLDEKVLAVAGIYGPNASGKSNVLEALAWLCNAVGQSFRTWDADVPRDPFRFGAGPSTPSTYEVDVMVDGVRYGYRLEVDSEQVLYESLHYYPHKRKNTLFERRGLDFAPGRDMTAAKGIGDLVSPRTLVLSSAMRLDHRVVAPFGRTIAGGRLFGRSRGRLIPSVSWGVSTARWFQEAQVSLFDDPDRPDLNRKDSALKMLQFADLGISDVRFVDDAEGRRRTQLVHRAGTEEVAFDMADESVGTQTWYRLIGTLLGALERGQLILFDELDASLHPALSARLVELFQDPATNPKGAQLIFTSHDTSLLNQLNRDEVWFTEKTENAMTTLAALAEYKVRKESNIERSYLQGRFGAVPDLDRWLLHEAIGIAG